MTSYSDSIVFGVGDSGYVVVNRPVNTLAVDEKQNESSLFSVFPNPTNGQITIEFLNELMPEYFSLSIFNSTGQMVFYSETNDVQIELENLEVGLYILQLNAEGKTYSTKILKK